MEIPVGALPPLAYITDTDQGGVIAIMTALIFAFFLCSFMARLYIRITKPPWGNDDNTITIATILYLAQTALVFRQVGRGYGRAEDLVSAQNILSIRKMEYASTILYIIILSLSKFSFAAFYSRLTLKSSHTLAIRVILAASILWGIASVLIISIRCHNKHPWLDWNKKTCPGLWTRWEIVESLDIITEVTVFAMSIYLIKGLQMPSKLKWVVVGAFGSRLGVILIIILRIHYINHTLSSNNTNQASSTSSLLTQLQLGYSLISNTIPSLRPFMAAYEDAGPQKSTLKYSGSGANNSYPLSTLNTTTTSKHKSYSPNTALTSPPSPLLQYHPEAAAAATDSEFRPDQNNIHHMALVSHNKKKNKSGSISSSNSQRMMIQKTVDWSIQNEAEAEARERERTMQQQMDYGNRDGNGDGEFGGRV